MAICRVYLLTYHRNNLLPRALNSLLNQSLKDWVCELHNDAPEDGFPSKLVEKINDPRISMVNHQKNLGGTKSFNIAFKEVPEPFVSILEDDNWWEPHFLSRMVEEINKFPDVRLAWANMQLWQEDENGAWVNTGRCINEASEKDVPKLFYWPEKRQINGAIHSIGAVLMRSKDIGDFSIPHSTLLDSIEPVRERAFEYPILFVPQVLANFSMTVKTFRSQNIFSYLQTQILLLGTFFKHMPAKEKFLNEFVSESRSQFPRSTSVIIFAAFLLPECRKLFKYVTGGDWMFFILSFLKHPLLFLKLFKAIPMNKEVFEFLDKNTALRLAQAKKYGFNSL